MNEVCTIGLDLAKNVFLVHGADASGGPNAASRRMATYERGSITSNLSFA